MVVLYLLLIFAGAGIAYQALSSRYDTRRFQAPGNLINVGKCRLHLNDQGAGTPAVVLESGIAASSLSWALVQPRIAEFTRVCSYDRAGLAWSERGVGPRTLHQLVYELDTLLSKASLPSPYILVGHSFGAIVIRAYANLHTDKVAGLVLVDPVSLRFWANCARGERKRLELAARLSRRGALLARLGIVRAALAVLAAGGKRFPKIVAQTTARQGAVVLQRLVGEVQKLPQELWPIVRSHWSRPRSFRAMADYLECLPESARTAISMQVPPNVPLIVLSASTATRDELEERQSWVAHSENGLHIRAEEGGHWLQLEQPGMIVGAIREAVERTRKQKSTGGHP
ncbi:MAG: alpha/beta hydrolase [Acidobacteriaceae bacterium]|nr:alpha/beta hydrolase [Acidobacteriaceae bacterium]MBV9781482.1 alpha/beta hydrolase [Acidobacteriaceae bacterium]